MIVIMPMAGVAKRFVEEGFILPKPLVEINNKPMIEYVLSNFDGFDGIKFLPIVLKEHIDKFHIDSVLKQLIPETKLFGIHIRNSVSSGAAQTVLDAIRDMNVLGDEEIVVCNCDQFINWNIQDFILRKKQEQACHWILTFRSVSPKWSYVRIKGGLVTEVAEKNPISNIATVGIYFFNKCSDFIFAAEQMINKNIRVNGEFYVCPVFNELVLRGDSVRIYDVEMFGMGTPEDLINNKENIKLNV